MKYKKTFAVLVALAFNGAAHAQEVGTIQTVPLAAGEIVIGTYQVPSIIQIPADTQIVPYTGIETTVPYEIDRVTGQPRNTEGWTGDATPPVAIACFPTGACRHLNR